MRWTSTMRAGMQLSQHASRQASPHPCLAGYQVVRRARQVDRRARQPPDRFRFLRVGGGSVRPWGRTGPMVSLARSEGGTHVAGQSTIIAQRSRRRLGKIPVGLMPVSPLRSPVPERRKLSIAMDAVQTPARLLLAKTRGLERPPSHSTVC